MDDPNQFMTQAAAAADNAVDGYFRQHTRADRALIAAALIRAYGEYVAASIKAGNKCD